MLYRFRKAMQFNANRQKDSATAELLQPSTCQTISDALDARRALYKEISRKISRIHDEELEESAIRSLNDDINRQIRQAREWDACLIRLGHRDRDRTMKWGDEKRPEPGNVHGYLYFGRAKTLPGVQELLNPKRSERTALPPRLLEMQRNADDEYFGVLAEDQEETLQQRERETELQLIMQNVPALDWLTGLPVHLPPVDPQTVKAPSSIPVPSQAEVEAYLIDRRRAELRQRYASK